ncbi:hypothetical protein ERN12_01255 [Rhodobacteraceae bacterium]|nr:hypothetical protein ERN12_01255 [Paracoccaceae bacterium]
MARLKAILVFITTLAFVASPLWSPSFKGYDPSQFPNPSETPAIQPAGWAFSIWSVIYLWLVISAAYGLWRKTDDSAWDAPRWPLIISTGLGISWLTVATYMPWLATVQIWLMCGAAIWAVAACPKPRDPVTRWGLRAPAGLYAGWLTAASGVGTGVVLIGYNVASELTITLLMLGLIAAVAFTVLVRFSPPVTYPLALVWALFGIIMANWGNGVIMLPCFIVAVALAALAAYQHLPRPKATRA